MPSNVIERKKPDKFNMKLNGFAENVITKIYLLLECNYGNTFVLGVFSACLENYLYKLDHEIR